MISFYFKDFNMLYEGLNSAVLEDPGLIRCVSGTMGLVHPLSIHVKSTNCDEIDLAKIGYTRGKWSNLLSTYLGPDRHVLKSLKLAESLGGLSCSFDFHRKKVGNGACLLSITLTRTKRSKPWQYAYITFRSSELHNKLPVDLILISKLIDYIPNTDIQGVIMLMIQPFQNVHGVQPMARFLWDIDVEKIETSDIYPEHKKYIENIIKRKHSYYDNRKSTVKQLSAGKRAIQLYHDYEDGKKMKPIKAKNLSLED